MHRSLLALIAGSFLAAPVAVFAAQAECVQARVDEPYRLPDGSVQPAGTLKLCAGASFSPVASLHRTYVNGQPVGILRSRHRTGEEARGGAFVTFARDALGTLRLLGYGGAQGGSARVYQLAPPPRDFAVPSRVAEDRAPPGPRDVLVATRAGKPGEK